MADLQPPGKEDPVLFSPRVCLAAICAVLSGCAFGASAGSRLSAQTGDGPKAVLGELSGSFGLGSLSSQEEMVVLVTSRFSAGGDVHGRGTFSLLVGDEVLVHHPEKLGYGFGVWFGTQFFGVSGADKLLSNAFVGPSVSLLHPLTTIGRTRYLFSAEMLVAGAFGGGSFDGPPGFVATMTFGVRMLHVDKFRF